MVKGTKLPGGFLGHPGEPLLPEAVLQSCPYGLASWGTLSEAAFHLVTKKQELK